MYIYIYLSPSHVIFSVRLSFVKELFQIGLVGGPGMAPKKEELFQIALVDCPHMAGVRLMDRPRMEPLKQGGVLDPLLLLVCDAAGLFNWYQCFNLQRSRELV